MPNDISPDASNFLDRSFEINHSARPTAKQLLEHPFIAPKLGGPTISAAQARSAMAAASKTREAMMGGMQSLSALADARG